MKSKLTEWVKRYLPAEIFSFIITLLSAGLVYRTTGNQLATALAGTWGGNLSYFGFIIVVDILQTLKKCKTKGALYTWQAFLNDLRLIALEFGVAEIIDSFLIRPLLMYYLPALVGNLSLGIIFAKIAADITFYIPVIVSYEISRRHLKDPG